MKILEILKYVNNIEILEVDYFEGVNNINGKENKLHKEWERLLQNINNDRKII